MLIERSIASSDSSNSSSKSKSIVSSSRSKSSNAIRRRSSNSNYSGSRKPTAAAPGAAFVKAISAGARTEREAATIIRIAK